MTGSQSAADIERIFACTAHGVIHKSGKTDELATAERAVYACDVCFTNSTAALKRATQFDVQGELARLTEREKEVLRQMAAGVSSATKIALKSIR